jgi:hypothetical protein
MKKVLFIMFAAAMMVFAGCKSDDDEAIPNVYEDGNAPPYATSKKVWTFGDQTWSDAIHCPECNIESFEDSYNVPQCYSYTADRKTRYFYNWAYVKQNADVLCPSPWRVPSQSDIASLADNTTPYALTEAWEGPYGDVCKFEGNPGISGGNPYYWSSTEHNSSFAYYLYHNCESVEHQSYYYKNTGWRVRCVRDN